MPTVTIKAPVQAVGPEITVNTAIADDQVNPIVERLANGNYLVVWEDRSQGVGGAPGDNSLGAVKGQILAADGSKFGTEFLVNVSTGDTQSPLDIVPLADGGFAVIYQSPFDRVKIRSFDEDGTPTSAEVDVGPGQGRGATGIELTDGRIVVSFANATLSIFDSDLTPIRLGDPAAGDQHLQVTGALLALADGGFAHVWGLANTFNGPAPIARISISHADGTSGFAVLNSGGITPFVADAIEMPDGNILVVSGFPSGDANTWVTVVSPTGTILSEEAIPSPAAQDLDLEALAGGGYLLHFGSFVQLIDSDGSLNGTLVFDPAPIEDDFIVVRTVSYGPDPLDVHSQRFVSTPYEATEQVNRSLKDMDMTIAGTSGTVTATLSVDYGVLFVTAGTSGTIVSGSGTGSVTITGTQAQINALLDSDPSSTVEYQANTDQPPAETILTLSIPGASARTIIEIAAVDDLGTATDDAATTDEGTTVVITPAANDSDPDGNTLSTVNGVALAIGQSMTLASGAVVTRTGAETLAYDPNGVFDALAQGATDADSFGYTIVGGGSATVNITINGLAGTSGIDTFDFTGGGDVVAGGSRGDDVFLFGATFTFADRVDGGDGNDQLRLEGDYSFFNRVEMQPSTMVNVESILVTAPFEYWLVTDDANVAAGGVLNVSWTGSGLGVLTFDGSAETDGRFIIDSRGGRAFLLGGGAADVLIGSASTDTLDGGGGADLMDGGAGDDIFAVDAAGDALVERVGEGSDRVYASTTYRLTADAEVELLTAATSNASAAIDLAGNGFGQAIFGNDGVNLLEGLGGNDVLWGLGGNDTIDGGTGGDQMHGGAGDDIYRVDGPGDNVVEAAGEGSDQVVVLGSFRLGSTSEVEFLSALSAPGTGTIDIAGSDTAQTIWGHAGSNSLEGFGGNDILLGMGGNDTLDGGTGSNVLDGGAGDDTFAVTGSGDSVFEVAGDGNDRVLAYGSFVLGGAEVELLTAANQNGTQSLNLTGSSFGQTIIGNEGVNELYGLGGADVLFGLGGNDVLDGGVGADVARGGAGDDAYAIDDNLDQVIEAAGEGYDRLFTTVDYRVGESQSIELLVADQASGAPLNLAGNNLSNTIIGNGGANLVEGHGGVDRLEGGGGDDTLDGGSEGDVLNGGAGADQFRFTAALDGNFDRIEDFLSGTDTIGLSRTVFTGLAAGSVPAGAFALGSAAADEDDRLIYNQATGQLFYDADGNLSGATAVLFATLQPGTVLAASDFVVI
jgi:Ca2+-binding RTX toxin-like protein